MTIRSRIALLLVTAVAVGACGKTTSMTAPTSTLRIDSVAPSAPVLSQASQPLTLTGIGFTANLDLLVTDPSGASQPSGVQMVTATQVTTNATFALPGTYELTLEDKTGGVSPQFPVVVSASGATVPVLSSVSPGSAIRSSQSQLILLLGTNLTGAQTVQLTGPDGQTTSLSLGQFTITGDTSISLSAVLNNTGLYLVTVLNNSGGSNAVSITVN